MTSHSEIQPGWIARPGSALSKALIQQQKSMESNLSSIFGKLGDTGREVLRGRSTALSLLTLSLLDRLEGWIKVAIATPWGIRPLSDLADLEATSTTGRTTPFAPALSLKQGWWIGTTRPQACNPHSIQRHRRREGSAMSVSRSSEVASQAVVRARTGRLWHLLWASDGTAEVRP